MIINNLPCIKNKCLLLPVCKTKEIIICNEVFDLLEKAHSIGNTSNEYVLLYNQLILLFPNIVEVGHSINHTYIHSFYLK